MAKQFFSVKLSCVMIAGLTSIASLNALAKTTIIDNINGYTLERGKIRQFTAIQFTDDKIDQLFDQNTKLPTDKNIIRVNGQGKTLMPGLIDAHGHVLSYGLSLLRADLNPSTSEQDAVERVVSYAKQHQQLQWIQGRGWNQANWPSKSYPSAQTLDRFFPDQPVWLRRVDGHAGWANSKAMALAGINKNSVSPDGGEILKNAHGEPTGIFIDNAMSLIDNAIAPLTLDEQKSVLVNAMNTLAAQGLTSVHDAGISTKNIAAYKALTAEGNMPIRVNAMLDVTDPNWRTVLAQGVYRSSDEMFTLNSVKISSDGALGSRGAALHQDYSDMPHHRGLLLHSEQQLASYIEAAMEANFQVNTHAIGDRANSIVIEQYKKLIKATDTRALRHRIEHAQVLTLDDITQLGSNGIIASMQATHATSDKNMAEDRLGKERLRGAYAWRKVLSSDTIIAAGSDFPVESANPFFGLHASVTRQDHQNQPENGWYPAEKMTREEAFKSFTIDAAFAGHQEHLIGSLAKGKKADFILVEDDFFTVPAAQIWQNKVIATWVNGQQVF